MRVLALLLLLFGGQCFSQEPSVQKSTTVGQTFAESAWPDAPSTAVQSVGSARTLELAMATSSSYEAAPPASSAFVEPATVNIAAADRKSAEAARQKRFRRQWIALAVTQHAAATFDAWTTRQKLSTGRYHETNPLLKPFASNASIYPAVQVAPILLDYVGRRMQKSSVPFVNRFWWVPQAVQTAIHFSSAASNLAQ